MNPSDFFDRIQIRKRARDAQHAMIAARGELHALGRIAQQRQALCVGLRDIFQYRRRCI